MKINKHENIEVQLIDFRFQVISKFNQNFRHIYDHVIDKSYENPEYQFVSTIDPYSYTMYNSLQVPFLIDELQNLSNEDDDAELKHAISELIEYLKTTRVHEFIQFLGD